MNGQFHDLASLPTQPFWPLQRKDKSLASARNQTPIPGLSNLYPSHYTDRAFPASQVHPVTLEICVNAMGSQNRLVG